MVESSHCYRVGLLKNCHTSHHAGLKRFLTFNMQVCPDVCANCISMQNQKIILILCNFSIRLPKVNPLPSCVVCHGSYGQGKLGESCGILTSQERSGKVGENSLALVETI